MAKRLYEILGTDENCDQQQIRQAYRKKALQNHPDRNQGNKEAEERFKAIASAYEILSDKEKRKQYDDNLIDDMGNPVQAQAHQPKPKANAQPKTPEYHAENKRSTPRNAPGAPAQERPQPKYAAPSQTKARWSDFDNTFGFHKSPPTIFTFFPDRVTAAHYRPSKNTNYFVYTTSSPLDTLFRMMQSEFNNCFPQKNNAQTVFHHQKATANNTEHVYIKTYQPEQVERLVDRLIANMILLELINQMQEPRANASFQFR
jgi:curved DNA-binding protein CbpA